jgi:dihydropteroate synthase
LDLIEGKLGKVVAGDRHPVRIMAVINLSRESFYKGSVARTEEALDKGRALQKEGADLLDIGAVSTAPGSPYIDEIQERERLFPVLKEILQNLEIEVSVDTQRAKIAEKALDMGAACINDVSGLSDPEMCQTIAEHDSSAIVMASRSRPGDLLDMDEILRILGERLRAAQKAGITLEKLIVDPGVGRWIPEKLPEHDLSILDGFRRLRVLGRPVVAAISRKSFIGARLSQPDPAERLSGSLAATAIAVYNGAHIVRTHDVATSIDTIRMAQAIRGRPIGFVHEDIEVELQSWLNQEGDLCETLRSIQVEERGAKILSKKGSFRILSVRGLSSMEAITIKQEMLARGGDAAIPKLALRCDPQPEEILIFGTAAQIRGVVRSLKSQPFFRLSDIGTAIDMALQQMDNSSRYR